MSKAEANEIGIRCANSTSQQASELLVSLTKEVVELRADKARREKTFARLSRGRAHTARRIRNLREKVVGLEIMLNENCGDCCRICGIFVDGACSYSTGKREGKPMPKTIVESKPECPQGKKAVYPEAEAEMDAYLSAKYPKECGMPKTNTRRGDTLFHVGCHYCENEFLRDCIGCKYFECDWSLPSKNKRSNSAEELTSELRDIAKKEEGEQVPKTIVDEESEPDYKAALWEVCDGLVHRRDQSIGRYTSVPNNLHMGMEAASQDAFEFSQRVLTNINIEEMEMPKTILDEEPDPVIERTATEEVERLNAVLGEKMSEIYRLRGVLSASSEELRCFGNGSPCHVKHCNVIDDCKRTLKRAVEISWPCEEEHALVARVDRLEGRVSYICKSTCTLCHGRFPQNNNGEFCPDCAHDGKGVVPFRFVQPEKEIVPHEQ